MAKSYPKYKGQTPIHWNWYLSGSSFGYGGLVDESIKFLDGGGTVMDIGFGDGLVASKLQDKGFKVYGVEPEQDGITAGKRMGLDVSRVLCTTIEEYVTGKMIPVDYLYSLNTIEHCDDPNAFVKAMESVKHYAIIVTDNAINKDGSRREVDKLHEKEFSYKELEDLFKDFKTEQLDVGNRDFIGIKVIRTD